MPSDWSIDKIHFHLWWLDCLCNTHYRLHIRLYNSWENADNVFYIKFKKISRDAKYVISFYKTELKQNANRLELKIHLKS